MKIVRRVFTVLLLPMALSLFVGCTKEFLPIDDSLPADGVIRFNTVVSGITRSAVTDWEQKDVDILSWEVSKPDKVLTRGAVVSGNTIPNLSSIGVSAFKVAGGMWNPALNTPDYFYNKKVTRQGDVYTYTGTEYWSTDPLRFFAYYPYAEQSGNNGIFLSPSNQAGMPITRFEVNADVKSQVDFMTSISAVTPPAQYASIRLDHALTRVGFSIAKDDNAIHGQVRVHRITLHNVVYKGAQTFSSTGKIVWNLTQSNYDNDVKDFVLSTDDGTLPGDMEISAEYKSVNGENGYLLMIPQEIKTGRVLLSIIISIDGVEKEVKTVLPHLLPTDIGGWSAGKYINYKYKIVVENNEYIIIPRVVGSANCFIINSTPRRSGINTSYINFSIPVTRVNEYYNNPAYSRFYGSKTGIAADTKWGVEVIWMDMANLLDIVKGTGTGDDPGADASEISGFNYSVAPDPALYNENGRFKIRVRAGIKGNALIGIFRDPNGNGKKDTGEAYLWSWHLWISDYDPNFFANGTITALPEGTASGSWSVQGGDVQRYFSGTNNGYMVANRTGLNVYRTKGKDINVWNSAGGLYNGLAMMDRNIGAFSTDFPELQDGSDQRLVGSLYYQYGRKDPFLSNAYSYKIDGTPIPLTNEFFTTVDTKTIQESIENPQIFPRGQGSWAAGAPLDVLCHWFDPTQLITDPVVSFEGKSIFDPSPYGWKLPIDGTWSGLTLVNTPFIAGFGRESNLGFQVKFPAVGFRAAASGAFVAVKFQEGLWSSCNSNTEGSSTAIGGAKQYYFFRAGGSEDNLFDVSANGFTTDAMSVRPIQNPSERYPYNPFP